MRKKVISNFLAAALSTVLVVLFVDNIQNKSSSIETQTRQRHQCYSSKKLAFMKTHKCASSTIENIMFRHALREDLNLAVADGKNFLSRADLFNRSIIENTPWRSAPVDLFTLHNRWNYNETAALLNSRDPLFTFTILRDPVNQFESLYSYQDLKVTFGVDLKGFVNLLKNHTNSTDTNTRQYGLFGRNQIAFDLGIDPSEFDKDETTIEGRIKKLDDEFKLVMISERMEESLVLLADYLCWPLEHVRYLDLNVRKPEMNVPLTGEERKILQDWLNVDTELYRYFESRLNDHIAEVNGRYGRHWMKEKVQDLRGLNRNLKSQCVIEQVGNEKLTGKFYETSNSIMGYLVRNQSACEEYAMSEPAFLDLFRKKLTEKYATDKRS